MMDVPAYQVSLQLGNNDWHTSHLNLHYTSHQWDDILSGCKMLLL